VRVFTLLGIKNAFLAKKVAGNFTEKMVAQGI
jgi:hypothetical protein